MKDMVNQIVKGLSETQDQKHLNEVTQSLFSTGIIKK
jgi:hypothetical protein